MKTKDIEALIAKGGDDALVIVQGHGRYADARAARLVSVDEPERPWRATQKTVTVEVVAWPEGIGPEPKYMPQPGTVLSHLQLRDIRESVTDRRAQHARWEEDRLQYATEQAAQREDEKAERAALYTSLVAKYGATAADASADWDGLIATIRRQAEAFENTVVVLSEIAPNVFIGSGKRLLLLDGTVIDIDAGAQCASYRQPTRAETAAVLARATTS